MFSTASDFTDVWILHIVKALLDKYETKTVWLERVLAVAACLHRYRQPTARHCTKVRLCAARGAWALLYLTTEAAVSAEMLVPLCQLTWCHTPHSTDILSTTSSLTFSSLDAGFPRDWKTLANSTYAQFTAIKHMARIISKILTRENEGCVQGSNISIFMFTTVSSPASRINCKLCYYICSTLQHASAAGSSPILHCPVPSHYTNLAQLDPGAWNCPVLSFGVCTSSSRHPAVWRLGRSLSRLIQVLSATMQPLLSMCHICASSSTKT
jgi:hypothetical protein